MAATRRPAQPVGTPTDAERPDWFRAFLTDRATRKPSPHTLQAYRQDFDAIAADVAGGRERIASLSASDITKESMRQAFAAYADSHEAASIRRCWSTWNTLCSYLFTAELLAVNPMQLVGRPNRRRPFRNRYRSPQPRPLSRLSGNPVKSNGEANGPNATARSF
jgi:site-specific recombinase XerC